MTMLIIARVLIGVGTSDPSGLIGRPTTPLVVGLR
jgi:hypothetical protein